MSTKPSTGRVHSGVRIHQGPSKSVQRADDVSRSRRGSKRHYEWLQQPLSNRAHEDARRLRLIQASFVASHGIYCAARVFLDLREAGKSSCDCVAASRAIESRSMAGPKRQRQPRQERHAENDRQQHVNHSPQRDGGRDGKSRRQRVRPNHDRCGEVERQPGTATGCSSRSRPAPARTPPAVRRARRASPTPTGRAAQPELPIGAVPRVASRHSTVWIRSSWPPFWVGAIHAASRTDWLEQVDSVSYSGTYRPKPLIATTSVSGISRRMPYGNSAFVLSRGTTAGVRAQPSGFALLYAKDECLSDRDADSIVAAAPFANDGGGPMASPGLRVWKPFQIEPNLSI
jgi:hypothetical protein